LICTGRYRVVHSSRCSRRAICSADAICPHPSHTNALELVISIPNVVETRRNRKFNVTDSVEAALRRRPFQASCGEITSNPRDVRSKPVGVCFTAWQKNELCQLKSELNKPLNSSCVRLRTNH